ncbi:MAG: flagellar assembly protein FliW [Thermodesulfobacteriota bacterium]
MNAVQQEMAVQPHSEKRLLVQTSRFGEIAVDPDRVISMVSPFLGFPESHRFILRSHSQKSPFMWLQSLDNPDLAFVVIDAALLDFDYKPTIPRQIVSELELAADDERDILLILTIPKDNPRAMTANLLGPVILNTGKRLARQVVLDPHKYDPCRRLFPDTQ